MVTEEFQKHRMDYMRRLAEIVRPTETPISREQGEAACQALCAIAGSVFASLNGIHYIDIENAPDELMEAAYNGLVRWKQQWKSRN